MKIRKKLNTNKRSIILTVLMLLFMVLSINAFAYAEDNHVSCAQERIPSYSLKSKSGGFENSYRYYGDVNNDTKINMLDVTLIQKKIAGLKELSTAARIASDVDGNQITNMEDVVIIQQYTAMLINSFRAGKLFHVIY